jgi:3-hydroxyisobutyrate dehydrogenase-like beta-hydroxyacid dehydrogenase
MTVVGVVHPGEMGVAVAGALRAAGTEVVWAGEGRSGATRARAATVELHDVGTLRSLVHEADVIVSVCPPHAALDTARAVADHGFGGVYLDANAVSPATAVELGTVVATSGARFVDGGIIGPPSGPRLLLAGDAGGELAPLFGPPVVVVGLDEPPPAASAVKMTYAAWTKGSIALLLAIRAAAASLGVEQALLAEWAADGGGTLARSNRSGDSAHKAWRWVGEMEEIARTLDGAGLPDGFHLAAADVYRRLARFKDDRSATLDQVLDALR